MMNTIKRFWALCLDMHMKFALYKYAIIYLSFIYSVSPAIPQIRLFQTLTLKLQGQGHGCGQMARPYSQPSI